MGINFQNIPVSQLRLPGSFAEFISKNGNTGQVQQRTLLIGQMTSTGTYVPNVPIQSTGLTDTRNGAGPGSVLAQMYRRYRLSDTFGNVWLLPIADDSSAVAATFTATVTGPASAVGTIALYIGSARIAIGVASGDSATIMATNTAAAVNAITFLPVSAAAAAGVVTFTAKNKGLLGNDLVIQLNLAGAIAGEVLPAGVAIAIAAVTPGTVNPSLTAALAALASQTFDFIVMPYADVTSLNAIQAFLNDTVGRWSWQQQLYGGCFTAARATFSGLVTLGTARNDKHTQIMGVAPLAPDPTWEWAADYGAASAVSLRANPAQPLNTLALTVLPPPIAQRLTPPENNTLLFSGITTVDVDDSNTVRINRSITTYQTDPSGNADSTFLNTEFAYQLQFCARDMIAFTKAQFARSVLVTDGSRPGFGSVVITLPTIRATIAGRYQKYCDAGLMQNAKGFAAAMQLTAASGAGGNGGQVLAQLPFQASEQFENLAMQILLQAA